MTPQNRADLIAFLESLTDETLLHDPGAGESLVGCASWPVHWMTKLRGSGATPRAKPSMVVDREAYATSASRDGFLWGRSRSRCLCTGLPAGRARRGVGFRWDRFSLERDWPRATPLPAL